MSRPVLRKSMAACGASALLVVAGVVTAGPAAARGGCGDQFNPTVSGGEAYWQLTCSDGKIRMKGWVKDTRADGKCARVRAEFNDATYYSGAACPKDDEVNFDWTRSGRIANGYLSVT